MTSTRHGTKVSADPRQRRTVINFTRSIAIELGEYGIRVNAIAPGHIPATLNTFSEPGLTEAEACGLNEAIAPVWRLNQPLARQGRPVDAANVALFLASERSAQMTVQVLAVDGGVTAGDPLNLHAKLMEAKRDYLQSLRKQPD